LIAKFSRNVPHNARGKPLEKGFHMSGNTDKAAGMANEVAGKVKKTLERSSVRKDYRVKVLDKN
jgi:hypothetical protein